jgi:polysaccharide deacetylase family protein (PEP-CTERM system associated)
MKNAFTIDLEDWGQSTLGPDRPLTPRVVRNTERMLELLRAAHVRATFFVLAKVAEEFPDTVRAVQAAGHEIASHGYGHELVFTITPQRFRDDIRRSVDLIGEVTGVRPIGYRAPAFSVTEKSLWAPEILADEGFKYSSSVFPFAGRRYGIPTAPRFVHKWDSCDLIEFPMTTAQWMGRNWPVCGGGYFRLLPGWLARAAIRRVNREGQSAVIYMHPYEIDVHELSELKASGWEIPAKTHFMQALFRGRIEPRLRALFPRFEWATMEELLADKLAETAAPPTRLRTANNSARHG